MCASERLRTRPARRLSLSIISLFYLFVRRVASIAPGGAILAFRFVRPNYCVRRSTLRHAAERCKTREVDLSVASNSIWCVLAHHWHGTSYSDADDADDDDDGDGAAVARACVMDDWRAIRTHAPAWSTHLDNRITRASRQPATSACLLTYFQYSENRTEQRPAAANRRDHSVRSNKRLAIAIFMR